MDATNSADRRIRLDHYWDCLCEHCRDERARSPHDEHLGELCDAHLTFLDGMPDDPAQWDDYRDDTRNDVREESGNDHIYEICELIERSSCLFHAETDPERKATYAEGASMLARDAFGDGKSAESIPADLVDSFVGLRDLIDYSNRDHRRQRAFPVRSHIRGLIANRHRHGRAARCGTDRTRGSRRQAQSRSPGGGESPPGDDEPPGLAAGRRTDLTDRQRTGRAVHIQDLMAGADE